MSRYLLISDTHMPRRGKALPKPFVELAAHADAILHTGDFTELSVVLELECYSPIYAVQGNNDSLEVVSRFPEEQIVDLDGLRVGMTHGHLGSAKSTPERAREQFSAADVDLIVFGHSHIPFDQDIAGIRCLNPGSLCDPRRQPTASFISLIVTASHALKWNIDAKFHYI